jgi:hypothetical protein
MSRSAEAVPSRELTECPRCTRLYHPPHPDGCWPCRRLTRTQPRLVTPEKTIDQLEQEAEAEAATYYFLESLFGHPDDL